MNNFNNDYDDFGHINIIKSIEEKIDEHNAGYSKDIHCKKASNIIKNRLSNNNVDIHFVHGGTIANILALTHNLMNYEGIVSARTGHILDHETGAIEATGHKIITIDTEDGKLSRELLKEKMLNYQDEIDIMPRIVYISNTTELGTVYTKKEIEDIYLYCQENNLYLYIDGARLASSLTCDSCDIKFEDLPNICDIFTIGGTKNGAMLGEALVIVNNKLKENFRYSLKQRGAMLAKGFLIGIQFEELFKEDLYFKLARHSNNMAKLLGEHLIKENIDLYMKQESNQVFAIFNDSEIQKLSKNNSFSITKKLDNNKSVVRFVTSYRTKEEEILSLVEDIKKL